MWVGGWWEYISKGMTILLVIKEKSEKMNKE